VDQLGFSLAYDFRFWIPREHVNCLHVQTGMECL
jgi:hypothetical protein